MTKPEQRVLNSIFTMKDNLGNVIQNFALDTVARGYGDEKDFDNFSEHIHNLVDERLRFLKNDMECLWKEREGIGSVDTSENVTSK